MTCTQEGPTLLERILERRDRERDAQSTGKVLIRESDALLEVNRQGTMRWYMHPELPGACINSLIVYRYELPPHRATGEQKLQGNLAAYAISGFGTVVVDGVAHEWEAGDVIGLPPNNDGHSLVFRNEADSDAQIIVAQPNYVDIFGVDCGSGFEQVTDAEERQERG